MPTYIPIQAITLNANTATVSFTGIPQTYKDLILVIEGTLTASGNKRIYFNGLNTNQSSTALYGNGTSPASARYTGNGTCYLDVVNSGTNRFINTIQIMNYASQTTNKAYLSSHNSAAVATENIAGLWSSTSAITSFDLVVATGASAVYANGTTFTLYGIGTGSPKAFGGTTVTTDGTYWYHTFTSSGQFVPTQALTADYLVVAGGGAGGGTTNDAGGGGGAGGYRTSLSGGGSALSLTANTVYSVTVGAGGAGISNNRGGKGSNSVFASITSTGGGGGGGSLNGNGQVGGSGGGGGTGAGSPGGAGNEGGYTPAEGYAGATSYGGGGGASGASTSNFGANGVANSISGTSVYYAGGGGSLNTTASLGGGGRGEGPNAANNMTAGTANTGGGGGATWGNTGQGAKTGMAGGSGIVIVRYSV